MAEGDPRAAPDPTSADSMPSRLVVRMPALRAAVLVLPAAGALFAGIVLAGCGGSGAVTADSAEEAFARAEEALARRKYDRAVELYRTALDFGRSGDTADDAQLGLARAYAGSRQYLLAGAEFTRFVELYRADPRVEDAAYERILAYAALSPTYELDQTDTATAIQYIDGFLRQYPAGQHAPASAELLATLREKLAQKQYEEGRLYERRDLFEAAVISYTGLLTTYPTSVYADDAMLGALRTQVSFADNSVRARQSARYGEALRLYDRLTSLFPQSPTLAEAQTLYDRAYRGVTETAVVPAGAAAGAAAASAPASAPASVPAATGVASTEPAVPASTTSAPLPGQTVPGETGTDPTVPRVSTTP